jgi:hypothetical protein
MMWRDNVSSCSSIHGQGVGGAGSSIYGGAGGGGDGSVAGSLATTTSLAAGATVMGPDGKVVSF